MEGKTLNLSSLPFSPSWHTFCSTETAVSYRKIRESLITEKHPTGKIGFLFHMGHGHYAQFLNFKECCPQEELSRTEWIPLTGDSSGDTLAKLPGMPQSMRYGRHQFWHAEQAIQKQEEWDALFFAAMQVRFLPLLQSHRSYFYTDFSPSCKRELSPWHDAAFRAPKPIRMLKDAMHGRLHRACRGIFSMSQWAADGVVNDYGVDPKRMHVVLPGANLSLWPFIDRSERKKGPVRILMVGGQFPLKGGPLLLDWAEKTSARGWEMDLVTWDNHLPEWIRTLVGHIGPGDQRSVSLAPNLPSVRVHCGFKANTPELMSLYEQADIFCLPTAGDASSIASLEAMASGLPVIVGAVGGIPELIDDGRTGYLLERGNTQTLADRLEALIADAPLRLRLGVAARQSCETFFNVPRQMREIFDVIDRDGQS